MQSYFKIFKTIRLNTTHHFIIKTPDKKELQKIATNHSCNIEFKDIIKLYKDYTKDPFLMIFSERCLHRCLRTDNPLKLFFSLLDYSLPNFHRYHQFFWKISVSLTGILELFVFFFFRNILVLFTCFFLKVFIVICQIDI